MFKDLTGMRFGKLTPVEFIEGSGKSRGKWLCRCECGGEKTVRADALTSGATKSCGCIKPGYKRRDLTGERFGRLVVIGYSHTDKNRSAHYHCRCDCGTEKVTNSLGLRNGAVVSCGCYRLDVITKHSMSQTRLWSIWHKMKERCYNKNHVHYKNYGGRGIGVCSEWRDDFTSFKDWAVINGYKEDLTLDRIDNSMGYSPENCRFATPTEQMNNRRNNHKITYNGETHTLTEWARIKGISPSTLGNRIKRGLSFEEAITTPIDRRYSRH